ncbi:tryptophan halogenase [Amycolatopsis sp. WAC 01375]|uniref:tryptophan halogenase family protein n=1 Tax=unclassified Amycolatopsis TaxID=2618356 RepID=UPI00038476E8|nr:MULTISPECIES: tryptophan halogenase family protein [unclassified Amycolatopsis]AGE12641.1 HalI [Amycolatopsis sp. WAC 01375]QKN67389.1 tryptophan 7-halogenase [Streptomyces coelicolor]RSM68559.1 tryptophan halogenase [Amycolatopsis sp. WAC 01375]RSN28345.1 tryptophan halogenase [Amycolatopsis sp. WAC 01416]
MSVEEFDVVVAGGGPGGSTVASLVAMQGHRVLLLEKEVFPRYQIGESLLPSTVHGICRMLGVTDELAAAGFPVKRGGTFRWGARPEPWTFSFSVSPRITGPTSFAYQVERARFDEILLNNARRKGVVVREECTVTGVLEEGERVTGLRYTDPDGEQREVSATFVIDASGNKSRLYSQVGGTRNYSEFFRSLALFGYFEGGKRLPAPYSGNILSVAFDSGWFWYIPLSDTLTSVGAVVRREDAEKIQGDQEKALKTLIAECPLISEYLSDARRVTSGKYGELRVRKDYSYHQTSFWRPGMILVGDAACFVDPVFSSGVHLATYSGLLAARSINSVLGGDTDEKTALTEFEARYRREYGVFYEFLTSFYQMNVNEDSYFWQAKKVTNNQHTEIESFVDLVGGVSSGEAALTPTDRIVERSAEFSAAVDQMAGGDEDSMVPLYKSQVVKQVMQEAGQEQMRAVLGEDAEPELPLFPGGLVTSPDGMSWLPYRPA